MGQTSLRKKLCHLSVIITLSIAYLRAARESDAGSVTNKMRYGTSQEKYISNSMPLERALELTVEAARPDHRFRTFIPFLKSHMIHQKDKQQINRAKGINYESSDDEDRRLLDKFYYETKSGDPFWGDSLTSDGLWDEQEVGGLRTFLDTDTKLPHNRIGGSQKLAIRPETSTKGWTQDPAVIYGLKKSISADGESSPPLNNAIANYSPPLHLLTSYNPMASLSKNSDDARDIKENRLVGATLYGQDRNSRPIVSSKSAAEAIKLHDNLLRQPPRDGKVRVRMYYHRAIHDDKRLYGTGPWKYWGHGWGLEFGYDPRSEKIDKDFYQKGYTIERAFGRDFCRDKNNCRTSDPDFFKNHHNAGKYSEQHYRPKKLMKNSNLKPQRNTFQYRRV